MDGSDSLALLNTCCLLGFVGYVLFFVFVFFSSFQQHVFADATLRSVSVLSTAGGLAYYIALMDASTTANAVTAFFVFLIILTFSCILP